MATQSGRIPVGRVLWTYTGISVLFDQGFTNICIGIIFFAIRTWLTSSCLKVHNWGLSSALYLLAFACLGIKLFPRWALHCTREAALLDTVPCCFVRTRLTFICCTIKIGFILWTFLARKTLFTPDRRLGRT